VLLVAAMLALLCVASGIIFWLWPEVLQPAERPRGMPDLRANRLRETGGTTPRNAPIVLDATQIPVVKYDGLADQVRRNRGRVVVVTFWSISSTYDIRDLPEWVDLHKEYGGRELVILNVNIDFQQASPEGKARVLPSIRRVASERCGGLTNLILDEPLEVFHAKLRFTGTPCVYVFDPEGRWHFFEGGTEHVTPIATRALVEKLLEGN
jgi:hypothetical protein